MKVKKNYTKTEVLDGAKCGFEFEFYSSKDVFETAKEIAKFVKKRVVVPLALSTLGEPKPLYHSPVEPSADIFKLEPDYSGGKKMCELVTGPMKYKDARNVLIKMFEWISSNGYTNERCSIHVNISLDENTLPTKFTINNISIPKFILSFDEKRIYDAFPKRKDSVYARSIKQLRPNQVLFYSPSLEDFSRATLTLPADEKYYGVNFLKAEKGYLEYRYLGGKDYEKKPKVILDLVDYFILHLFDTLNFDGYTEAEKREFRKQVDLDKKIYEGFVKYEKFAKMFPDITVTSDMNGDPQVLEAIWGNIREKLYDLIITGKMRKGAFNYDSEVGRFQLKDTKLKNCKLSTMEFINCELEGVIIRSWFLDCKIKHSRISDSNFVKGNTVDFSKVAECELHVQNILTDCFIENKKNIINCEVSAGVIRNGEIGKLARISKETMMVEQIEPTEGTASGAYKDESKEKKKEDDKEDKKEKKK
jgi:hypothetical protein